MREALLCVENGDTIFFDPIIENDTIFITSSLIIDKNINIHSALNKNILIKSLGIAPLFNINSGINVKIEGIHVFGTGTVSSALIENNGNMTLKDINIYDLTPMDNYKSINNNSNLIIEGMVNFINE